MKNFASVDLPDNVVDILGLDTKFDIALDNGSILIPTITKNLEYRIDLISISEEKKNEIRAKSANVFTNFVIHQCPSTSGHNVYNKIIQEIYFK